MSSNHFIFSELDMLARFEVTAQISTPFNYSVVRIVPHIQKAVVSFREESRLALFFKDRKIVGPLISIGSIPQRI